MDRFVHCDLSEVSCLRRSVCLIANRLWCSSSVHSSSNMPITIPTSMMPSNRFWTPSNPSSHLVRLGASECQTPRLRPHTLILHRTFSMTRGQNIMLIRKTSIERGLSIKERIQRAGHHLSTYRTPSYHSLQPEPARMPRSKEFQSVNLFRIRGTVLAVPLHVYNITRTKPINCCVRKMSSLVRHLLVRYHDKKW